MTPFSYLAESHYAKDRKPTITNGAGRHAIEAVTTAKLRTVVTATNGDPAAAIYEIQCYAG
ncbi:MAG: hypothetical protein ACREH8_11880 [Opitutaceae bacterium]